MNEPANSADPDQTALRTASLGAVGFYEEVTKITYLAIIIKYDQIHTLSLLL